MSDDDPIPLADDSPHDSGGSFDIHSLAAQPFTKTAKRAASKKQGTPFLWIVIGAAAVVIGTCVIAAILNSPSDQKTAERIEAQKSPALDSQQAARQRQPADDRKSPPQAPFASAKKDAPSGMKEATQADSDEALEREAKRRRQQFLSGQLVGSAHASLRPAPGERPAKKTSVPTAAAQADATKRIQELYGQEWAAAKTDDAKKVLAQKLLQKAWESDKDSATRFVLLRSSRDIATQAMDGWTAFRAIEDLDHQFEINALEMRATVLTKGALQASSTAQHDAVANKAAEISDEAIANDNFNIARQLNDLARSEAKEGNDPALATRAGKHTAEIDELSQMYEAVVTATATLKTSPADPDANLTIGKYKCFAKDDWEGGFRMLAHGSDRGLKTLASKELAGATSADEQARLGDGWWDLAENQTGIAKTKFRERAVFWYRAALPGLSGSIKDKVEKRLQLRAL